MGLGRRKNGGVIDQVILHPGQKTVHIGNPPTLLGPEVIVIKGAENTILILCTGPEQSHPVHPGLLVLIERLTIQNIKQEPEIGEGGKILGVKCLNILLRSLIDKQVGGVRQGSKGEFGIEKEGAFRSHAVRIPSPAKKELVCIWPKVKIHMIQSMSQVSQCLVAKTLFKGGIVIPLYLVHVGIERHILEACKIMLELPGVDVKGGINHLSADSR